MSFAFVLCFGVCILVVLVVSEGEGLILFQELGLAHGTLGRKILLRPKGSYY
jgi:hypothetical protein